MNRSSAERVLPCLTWLRAYDRDQFAGDLVAAVIVTLMLIPQSLAYALLAGLPAVTGLYASILPLVAYAMFGSSRTLSVGPVAIISLMTAAAIANAGSTLPPAQAAMVLALLAGGFMLVLGVLRFGFLANFLSHPVVSGFISASAVLIALGQVPHLLGVSGGGDTLPEMLHELVTQLPATNTFTLALGAGSLLFLLWARSFLPVLLRRAAFGEFAANLLARLAPLLAVIITGLIAFGFDVRRYDVALVGAIPAGLPQLRIPMLELESLRALFVPAMLIAVIGYVESIAVGRTLAARRRQKIQPDQELIGLGAANIAAAFGGGFPVTGGFSRSIVNFDAGAATQAAGAMAAMGILAATLFLTGALAWLPNATLAATIIAAVLSLMDFTILRRAWQYARSDFAAVATTIAVTLLLGVELGVSCGVAAALVLHLYHTSRPHIAEVGELGESGHFRNVKRHAVHTHPALLSLRIDESLYFANVAWLEDEILRRVLERPGIRHVILVCTAVNSIDLTALEALEEINTNLREQGINFHLSEVKGPVMDAIADTRFLQELNGEIFMSQRDAVRTLEERDLKRTQT